MGASSLEGNSHVGASTPEAHLRAGKKVGTEYGLLPAHLAHREDGGSVSAVQRKGWSRHQVILIVAVFMAVAWLILHQFCGVSPREFVVGAALWASVIAAFGILIALMFFRDTTTK